MIDIQDIRVAKGLAPVADAFSGTVRPDVYNMSGMHKALFIIYKGVGTTGTSTVTVTACDDVTPSNETAVVFRYRRLNDADAPGAVTWATTSGFTTTAGSDEIYLVEVDAKAIASTGYKYVSLKMVESVDSPVVGSIVFIGVPRYADSTSAITS